MNISLNQSYFILTKLGVKVLLIFLEKYFIFKFNRVLLGHNYKLVKQLNAHNTQHELNTFLIWDLFIMSYSYIKTTICTICYHSMDGTFAPPLTRASTLTKCPNLRFIAYGTGLLSQPHNKENKRIILFIRYLSFYYLRLQLHFSVHNLRSYYSCYMISKKLFQKSNWYISSLFNGIHNILPHFIWKSREWVNQ